MHISRTGSVEVTTVDGMRATAPFPDNFGMETFSGTSTFRDRAKNAIKMTLSPGSEFSFEDRLPLDTPSHMPPHFYQQGTTEVDVETSLSLGKLENVLKRGGGSAGAGPGGRTNASEANRILKIENELLEARQRLAKSEERLGTNVESPLSTLRRQLDMAQGMGVGPQVTMFEGITRPDDVRVRNELNATLRRLEAAASREGALRMENHYLRTSNRLDGTGAGAVVPTVASTTTGARTIKKPDVAPTATEAASAAANDSVSRNLILRCALLEEKLESAEIRANRAETTVEALVQQLKRIRSQRTQEALERETKLYSRIEANMASVFDVTGPLLDTENKAHERHAEIAENLHQLDTVMQRKVATLRNRVKQLEGENSKLGEELQLRPMYKDYKELLHRENALHDVIHRNNIAVDAASPGGGKPATQDAIRRDRTLTGVDSADLEHAQERVSRFMKGEKRVQQQRSNQSEAAEPKPDGDGIFSGPLRPPLDQISVLWAAASVLRDVVDYLNVDSVLEVLPRIKELSQDGHLHSSYRRFVEAATDEIERGTRIDVGRVFDPDKKGANEAPGEAKLRTSVLSLDQAMVTLVGQMRERRAMAFAQTAPQLLVHQILVQFQMLLNVDAGDRVVPALQNLVSKLRASKMVLQKIRGLFGLPRKVDDDGDLLSVVQLYVRNLGLAQASDWPGIM